MVLLFVNFGPITADVDSLLRLVDDKEVTRELVVVPPRRMELAEDGFLDRRDWRLEDRKEGLDVVF